MGIRPTLHMVAAITNLETKIKEYSNIIIDDRWTLKDEQWNERSIFGPQPSRLEALHKVAFNAQGSYEAFQEYTYLEAARDYCRNKEKVNSVLLWDYYYPEVMALSLTRLPHDHTCLWALAAVHPEYHSKNIFVEIPRIKPEDDCSESAGWWKLAQKGNKIPYPLMVQSYQEKLDDDHNYVTFSNYAGPAYISWGLWFFKEILEMKIIRKDIRLGIYWQWS